MERGERRMEDSLTWQSQGGTAEPSNHLGMTPGCFRAAKSFVRGAMDRDEQLDAVDDVDLEGRTLILHTRKSETGV